MTIITVNVNGTEVSKKTTKTGITHAVTSMLMGKRVVSGMFTSQAGAEKRIMQGFNPAYTDHVISAIETEPKVATVEIRKALGALVGF